ncbi:PEP-CTERM sorting domain-containing protein [Akkermansiaceae bacterium]|nr:PEP-CTERM sorting domain-containing protein [Akkermansiaceae bacterium]
MKIGTEFFTGALLLLSVLRCGAAVTYDPERDFISPGSGGVPVDDHTDDLRRLDFDLNNDGRIDVSFTADSRDTLRISGPSTTHYLGQIAPAVLPKGYEINFLPEASSFRWIPIGEYSGVMTAALNTPSGLLFSGEWSFKTGYLGVRFEADDGDHFGYLHIDSRGFSQFHIEQAWESELNTPLFAGAIPEPSSILLIMMSSLGLLVRRRSE